MVSFYRSHCKVKSRKGNQYLNIKEALFMQRAYYCSACLFFLFYFLYYAMLQAKKNKQPKKWKLIFAYHLKEQKH